MRCIEYKGYIGNTGYGLDYDPDTQKTIYAHRLSFKQTFGFLPKVVMHTCDNPKCVNPQHLKAGTQSENIKDCIQKGRYVTRQKLSFTECLDIKKSSSSSRKLGMLYGVNQTTILNIKKNKYNYHELTGAGSCGV